MDNGAGDVPKQSILITLANRVDQVTTIAEAHVLLFEPASTLNTGNVQNERTVANEEHI